MLHMLTNQQRYTLLSITSYVCNLEYFDVRPEITSVHTENNVEQPWMLVMPMDDLHKNLSCLKFLFN